MPSPMSHCCPFDGIGASLITNRFSMALEFPMPVPPVVWLIQPNSTDASPLGPIGPQGCIAWEAWTAGVGGEAPGSPTRPANGPAAAEEARIDTRRARARNPGTRAGIAPPRRAKDHRRNPRHSLGPPLRFPGL